VKPAPFAFARPRSLDEAVGLLSGTADAKVLAGGQSLVPLLSMRLAAPSMLVDINALPDLDHVRVDDAGVHVGALARHADVLSSHDVRRVQPLVSLALSQVAHATIRNRGTTVGSIVHADAAAEMPMVLALLAGSVSVASRSGTRTIPAGELYATFPVLGSGEGVGFGEIARRHGDYALVGVGAVVRVDGDAVVSARAGYLSVSDVPTVVDVTSALETGISEDSLAAAGVLALGELDPADDLHATAAYRGQLVKVLTARVLRAAYDDARSRS
jgi:2-furoyl-CoA dehydrogenase FAD binding subunit